MTVDKVRECVDGKEVTVTLTSKEYELFKRVFSDWAFDKDDVITALGIYVPIKDLD